MIDLNLNPTQKELKQFSLIQLLFCILVSGWFYFKYGNIFSATIISVISFLVFLAARIYPSAIRALFVVLTIIAFPIGWVVSHVILFLVFYLLVTPVGLIMKLVGYDPLHRKIDKNTTSYWINRSENKSSESYFKQY